MFFPSLLSCSPFPPTFMCFLVMWWSLRLGYVFLRNFLWDYGCLICCNFQGRFQESLLSCHHLDGISLTLYIESINQKVQLLQFAGPTPGSQFPSHSPSCQTGESGRIQASFLKLHEPIFVSLKHLFCRFLPFFSFQRIREN